MATTGDCEDWGLSLAVVHPLLDLSDKHYLRTLRAPLGRAHVVEAVRDRQSPPVFEWMIDLFQYQGVSDATAKTFNDKHGSARFADLSSILSRPCTCSKLSSYWAFSACGYRKGQQSCARPHLLGDCPLPLHPARNGRLSQAAYSLHLFIRDVCTGDLIGWIDHRLDAADDGSAARARLMRDALLEPMANIYGVSRKVLSMALSDLLLGADPHRERWVTTGASMIAVDTLVHNFLVRTGILGRHGAAHAYGPACYQAGGCAEVVEMIADRVDARRYGERYPHRFPRFVQWAIWAFCAQGQWNICNGNNIDDRQRCTNAFCPIFQECERVRLT